MFEMQKSMIVLIELLIRGFVEEGHLGRVVKAQVSGYLNNLLVRKSACSSHADVTYILSLKVQDIQCRVVRGPYMNALKLEAVRLLVGMMLFFSFVRL